MADTATVKRYTVGEEIASAITHGLGTELSIIALVFLIIKAVTMAPIALRVPYIVGFTVFGSSMIILYLASTLYHALTNPTAKGFSESLTTLQFIF